MKKKYLKIFKIIAMLFLLVGTVFGSAKQNVKAQTGPTKVYIYKVLLKDSNTLTNFNSDTATDSNGKKYNGTQLESITTFFGTGTKLVNGVKFRIFKEVGENEADAVDSTTIPDLTQGKKYKEVTQDDANSPVTSDKFVTSAGNGVVTPGVTDDKSQGRFAVTLNEGKYRVIEDRANSPYYSTDGKELSAAKAIPFDLELPVGKMDGTGYFGAEDNNALHIYPKNIEDKPVVDKGFDKNKEIEMKTDNTGKLDLKSVTIGDEIPYVITTTIPKDAKYKTVAWEDTMVKGLDYKVGSIEVLSDMGQNNGNFQAVDKSKYTITESPRGFILQLKEETLKELETQAATKEVKFKITYKGVLNETAEVDTQIPNTVKFHYGNRPGFNVVPSTPKPGKPDSSSGKITVQKFWNGKNTNPNTEDLKFDVYEAETGKFIETLTLTNGQTTVQTTQALDNNKNYIVIEQDSKYIVEYVPNPNGGFQGSGVENGTFKINNVTNPNPTPLKPTPVNVKTHGKKFVKTNNEDKASNSLEKLVGAEFVIKNEAGDKFLKLKDKTTQEANLRAYNEAEAAYVAAVESNAGDKEDKKTARDTAYEALNMQWEFTTTEADAFKFISSTDGKFEVKGLAAGTYKLKETKAPNGYALLTGEQEFMVGDNTYTTDAQGLENQTQVKNKKITIPQTGGMGTILFTAVGAIVMISAVYAMRRKKED